MPIEAPAPLITGNGPALIQFVDSISATATVRLDVNDGIIWFCQNFSAPPPRLRRSVSQNAMRDGEHVSSSAYDARVVELSLTLIDEASEEFAAQSMQALWRELDRPTNILRYQPAGTDKPVFFILQRSDVEELEELWTTPIARNITVALPAEPFALGLKETLGPFTISNDPLAATNPCQVDVSGTLGDVATPFVYWDSASGVTTSRWVGSAHTVAALSSSWIDAEAMSAYTDTTNPGGAADALMVGTASTNYLRTSFATTATMTGRAKWFTSAPAPRGVWKALAFLRRSGISSVLSVQMGDGPVVTVPNGISGTRLAVDLGTVSFFADDPGRPGYSASSAGTTGGSIALKASRAGGTDTLDWDGLLLVPAGGQQGEVSTPSLLFATFSAGRGLLDGVREQVNGLTSDGDPTSGGGTINSGSSVMAGAFPTLAPGAVNRITVVPRTSDAASTKATTTTVSLAYWPRYLFVRSSAS